MLIMNFLAAIGLFLLGIWLMTEGLKQAGGKALQKLLHKWTSSKPKSLGSGILITTLVQSSGAVIIASIGFINAGLMSFTQSVWVVFGSSLGSTFTGWLVTLFGFKLNIGAVSSLPLAIGAFLRLFAPYERGRFLGMALAGFGLMFMGIDVMKTTFGTHMQDSGLLDMLNSTNYTLVLGLLIGLVLTVLTQASSAAIAIILTATASNISGFEIAAAAVIGANIGSTSTSIIAMIGATSGAKRLAVMHVIFNACSGTIGILLLPVFVGMEQSFAWSGDAFTTALSLVMFHTFINIMGIIFMIPIEPKITRTLLKLFTKNKHNSSSKQHYIDMNVAEIPDLALRALQLELKQLFQQLQQQSLLKVIYKPQNPLPSLVMDEVLSDINKFIIAASQANLTREQSALFTEGLSVSHHLHEAYKALSSIRELSADVQRLNFRLNGVITPWLENLDLFSEQIRQCEENCDEQWAELKGEYAQLKQLLLSTAIHHHQNLEEIDNALLLISLAKRYIEQLIPIVPLLADLEVSTEETEALTE